MYDDITEIYSQIFPLNKAFLDFIPEFLPEPGASVLDLGCGPGDYVDALSRKGFRAIGIDSSQKMIQQAQVNKQGTFYPYSFTDIRKLTSTFDTAFCIGNSLSYLPNPLLEPFLSDLFDLLNPGGVFILQLVNWDKIIASGTPDFPVKTLTDGSTFHRYYEWVDTTRVIFHTEIRSPEGKPRGSWADVLDVKPSGLITSALQNAGMDLTDQFGDFQKSAFDPLSSPAHIVVALKPPASRGERS